MGRVQSSLVLQDRMTKVLSRINRAMELTIDSFEAVQKASGKSFDTKSITAAREAIGASKASLDEIEQSYKKIDQSNKSCEKSQEKLNNRISQGTTAAAGLLGKIKGVASAYIGIKTIKGAGGLSDTMTQTNARLNMMNDSLQTTEKLNSMIYASAQRSRGSYLSTADAVAKLGLMAGEAFGSNQETIAFMEQVNKQFKIAGTEASGIDAAMLQLTQAMGSGVLRGEEYNSILEQAPNIIQSIADYMDVPKGKLKDMAADGQITADIVKAAMFAAAEDTNAKFESMPKTWSDTWTSMKNRAIKSLDPVLKKINKLANSENVQRTVNGLINAFSSMSAVLSSVFEGVCAVYNFVADNWGWISPIVFGIVAAMTAYALISGIVTATNAAHAISENIKAAAQTRAAGATFAQTAAQHGLNAALLACPITWIVIGIIALIIVFYAAVAAVNKFAGTSVSATGIICGAFMVALAFIGNIFVALWNLLVDVSVLIYNIFASVANFIGNVFTDPIGAVSRLFFDLADTVLGILQALASAIDAVFGSDLAGSVQGWRDSLGGWVDKTFGKGNEIEAKVNGDDLKLGRFEYGAAWDAGYSFGENIQTGIGDFFNFGGLLNDNDSDEWDPIGYGGVLDSISDNTEETSQNTGKNTEDLSYLRDIAEREAINRFTTAEVKIDMSGMSNRIDSNMDLDGVLTTLTEGFAEALETAAEGVHA